MNSAPVSDSSAAATSAASSALLAFPGPASSEQDATGFGNLLAQVTAQSSEGVAEEVDESDPVENVSETSEKKEEKKSELDLSALPLVFFYPPAEIKPPPKLEAETTIEAPPEITATSEEPARELATCSPPVPKQIPQGDANPAIEIVRPKQQKILTDAKNVKISKEKSAIPKSSETSLDGFDSVIPQVSELTHLQGSKGLQPPSPAPVQPTHGTVVAQQEKAMRNAPKTAENATVIEQKMPVREQSRRILAEQARFDTAGFLTENPAHKSDLSIEPPAREISARSLEAAQLVETIRTEVTNLRHHGEASVTVALRPDNGTELKLEVTIARDGTIHANVRFERGDFQSLNAQWPQLQQSLAAQGIRVNDLSNPGNSNQHPDDSSRAQNFERGHNPQHRQQQHNANFEDELAASTPRYSTNKTFKTAAVPLRRWQSWA